jgi:hypothetical protein
MKLSTLSVLFASLVFAGCAAETGAPSDDAEDVGASQDELSAAAKQLVGNYEWRDVDSGAFVDFLKLDLHADGSYSASVDSGLVDPGVRCVRFPCTLPEAGTWSTFHSGGKLKIRVRPQGHPSRSYYASKAGDQLSLGRSGETTILFQAGQTTCANVRCAAGTHCEMKGINGGAIPVCLADAAPCVRSGCSGQICAEKSMITTCDWRPEYACYQAAKCERQADGACGFTQTPALATCLGSL